MGDRAVLCDGIPAAAIQSISWAIAAAVLCSATVVCTATVVRFATCVCTSLVTGSAAALVYTAVVRALLGRIAATRPRLRGGAARMGTEAIDDGLVAATGRALCTATTVVRTAATGVASAHSVCTAAPARGDATALVRATDVVCAACSDDHICAASTDDFVRATASELIPGRGPRRRRGCADGVGSARVEPREHRLAALGLLTALGAAAAGILAGTTAEHAAERAV